MTDLEDLLRETFAEASRSAPAELAAEPDAPARARDRRTRRGVAVLAVAAAVLAIAIGISRIGLPYPHGSSSPETHPPVGPGGATLVGFGRVAMPLPAGWKINDTMCGAAVADTVMVGPSEGASFLCLAKKDPDVSYIVMDEIDSPLGTQWSAVATRRITLAGGTLGRLGRSTINPSKQQRPGSRAGLLPGGGYTEVRQYVTVLAVPSLHLVEVGVSATVHGVDAAIEQTVRMPQGTIAMPNVVGQPWTMASETMIEAGLTPKMAPLPPRTNLPVGWVASSTPQPGVILPQGSTVILRGGSGRHSSPASGTLHRLPGMGTPTRSTR